MRYINPNNFKSRVLSGHHTGCIVCPLSVSDEGVKCEIVFKPLTSGSLFRNGDMITVEPNQLEMLSHEEYESNGLITKNPNIFIPSVDSLVNPS